MHTFSQSPDLKTVKWAPLCYQTLNIQESHRRPLDVWTSFLADDEVSLPLSVPKLPALDCYWFRNGEHEDLLCDAQNTRSISRGMVQYTLSLFCSLGGMQPTLFELGLLLTSDFFLSFLLQLKVRSFHIATSIRSSRSIELATSFHKPLVCHINQQNQLNLFSLDKHTQHFSAISHYPPLLCIPGRYTTPKFFRVSRWSSISALQVATAIRMWQVPSLDNVSSAILRVRPFLWEAVLNHPLLDVHEAHHKSRQTQTSMSAICRRSSGWASGHLVVASSCHWRCQQQDAGYYPTPWHL